MSEIIIGENGKEEVPVEKELGVIVHPFAEDIELEGDGSITMHIVGSIGARYIGGVVGEPTEVVTLFMPLMLMEAPQQNGSFGLGMRPIFMSLGLMNFITVKPDFIYTFQSNIHRDIQIVEMYEKQITSFRAQELGLIAPSQEEVMKINRR